MSPQIIENISQFIGFLQFEKRFSSHTTRAYGDDLRYFFDFMTDQYALEGVGQVTTPMVRSWMASLTLLEIQPRSINRKLSSLRTFFKFCLQNGAISKNPVKGLPLLKTRKRLPSFIEEDQMERLLGQVTFSDDYQGQLDLLVIMMLYYTGMRVSELANLQQAQVDLPRLQLKVLGKGNKERIIPIHSGLAEKIKNYQRARETEIKLRETTKKLLKKVVNLDEIEPQSDASPFFLVNAQGKPLHTRKIYDIVKKYLSLVTTAEKKSPHVLRHSFATHLTGNGAELNAVKELLGHSSLAATQVYTHNSIERLRDIHKKAHPKG